MAASPARLVLSLLFFATACTTADTPPATVSTPDAGSPADGGTHTGIPSTLTCRDRPPPNAPEPPALPSYSDGVCPTLVTGMTNTLISRGNARNFILAAPAVIDPDEPLPVLFLWHWLGGSAQAFYDQGDVARAVEEQRFIAIVPQEKGDLQFKWPDTALDTSQARFDEELTFFDDMLACVAEQFPVNQHCVSTAGVSAGALWTAQLMSQRADYLASFLSLSGGTGGPLLRTWSPPDRKIPGLVLWGGPTDTCGVDFDEASQHFEARLDEGGHFYVECVHNCGHTVPPVDPAPGESTFASLWQFVFDHPYWLAAGDSPYLESGLTANYPEWCGLGAGSATARTGSCSGRSGSCF